MSLIFLFVLILIYPQNQCDQFSKIFRKKKERERVCVIHAHAFHYNYLKYQCENYYFNFFKAAKFIFLLYYIQFFHFVNWINMET
jgi:hypothetical protein